MTSLMRQVVIALGTNLGDRGRNAAWALQQLAGHGIQVVRCSNLYETAPAYKTDQPAFLNAAVLGVTSLDPRGLLATLKAIEAAAGRDVASGPRWGPRPLDLDIVFMSGQPFTDAALQIPHPRWRERDFVLQPVSDLWHDDKDAAANSSRNDQHHFPTASPHSPAPGGLLTPTDRAVMSCVRQAHEAAGRGGRSTAGLPVAPGVVGAVLRRVTPVRRPPGRIIVWGQRTLLMGILNITPDSFSDGGAFMQAAALPARDSSEVGLDQAAVDLRAVVAVAERMVADGADILDVGGQSTRPGATRLTPEQELARVLPVVRALRSCPALDATLISIDTFYAAVAREAVAAGVDIVNDVSGGALDADMLAAVASLGVPYVCMHMRGDPSTMQQSHLTTYAGPVWMAVGQELQASLDVAVAAGIPAWNLITDPGIGFAKTSEGNISLLRDLARLRREALQGGFSTAPMLVGPSRKGFLGKLTCRVAPPERDAATVAAATVCVAGGADIVRAHNVRDVADGLRVADAVYRAAQL